MSNSIVGALREICAPLPDGAAVLLPVAWLRAQVTGPAAPSSSPTELEIDLTVADVARLLGRSSAAVRAWIRAGQLKAYQMQGREYRIRRTDLQVYLDQQRCTGHPISAVKTSEPPATGGRRPGRPRSTDLGTWRTAAGRR